MLWELLKPLFGFLFRREPGWDKFSDAIETRLTSTEKRLDDCESDRDEMRRQIHTLRNKVEDCDDDRRELRAMITALDDRTR